MIKNKLRLLFTTTCDRNCDGCCNKDWDLNNLDIVQHFNYDEILITGGEPLLKQDELIGFIKAIRIVSNAKIYVYTANLENIISILKYVDGITLTLHEQSDVYKLKFINDKIFNLDLFQNKSLRLNVFKGISLFNLDLSLWKIKKDIEWIKDCPLPENEEFKRI